MNHSIYNMNGESYLHYLLDNSTDMIFSNLEGKTITKISEMVENCLRIVKDGKFVVLIAEPELIGKILLSTDCYSKTYSTIIHQGSTTSISHMLVLSLSPIPKDVCIPPSYILEERRIEMQQKPTQLYRDIIETFSEVGDDILDAFMGRGILIRNAISLERGYIGCEENQKDFMIANNEIRKEEIRNKCLSGYTYYPIYATG